MTSKTQDLSSTEEKWNMKILIYTGAKLLRLLKIYTENLSLQAV